MYNRGKLRSKRKNLDFNLELSDIIIPEKCPVLGIDITIRNGQDNFNSSPSLDRIDNFKGYTKDNIVIVSARANRFKSDSTLDELKKVYTFYNNLIEMKNEAAVSKAKG